jgi:hypothetical protein
MGCGWWELKAGERWEDGGQGRKAWELGTRSEEFLRIWMASFGVRQGFDTRATGSEWIQGSEENGNFFAWSGRGVVERDGCGEGDGSWGWWWWWCSAAGAAGTHCWCSTQLLCLLVSMLQLLLALPAPHSSTTIFALAPLSCTALTALCSLCGCNQPFIQSHLSNSAPLTDFDVGCLLSLVGI